MEPPAEGSVAALRGGRIYADDTFLSLAPPVGAMPPARRVRLSPGAYARTLAWLRANPIPEAGGAQACDDHGRDEVSWSGAGGTMPDIRYSRNCPDPQMRSLISGIVRVSGAPTMPRDGSDRSDRMKGFEIRYPGR